MLRPFINISIQQATPFSYKDTSGTIITIIRNRLIELDFVEKYEIESSWVDHTDKAKISFPKNIKLSETLNDGTQVLFNQSLTYNVILGGIDNQDANGNNIIYAPLIMKGDLIIIQDGYWYKNENGQDIQIGDTQFSGYVSKVNSDIPIEIECEDNFYLLKRTPFDSSIWNKTAANGNTDLYSLMKHIIELVNIQFSGNSKYNILASQPTISNTSPITNPYPILSFSEIPNAISAQFSLGYLEIGDISCAEVLRKLKDQYHFESTFINNDLYFGVTIYNDSSEFAIQNPTQSGTYFFFNDLYQNNKLTASANIFDDCDLEYTNKEDIVLSAIVHCKSKKNTGKTTKDGFAVTKLEKLKILVYWDLLTSTFKYINLSIPGAVVPSNPDGGERHDFIYPIDINKTAPTITTLFSYGIEHLSKYFYTGFRGSFETFGFPFIRWNYNVNLIDPILSDRNGQYKVKKVIRAGGEGISQKIFLDFKINVAIPSNTTSIYML